MNLGTLLVDAIAFVFGAMVIITIYAIGKDE